MVSRNKFILWLLVTLALGVAGGYLFSSKFCNVTIVQRVEKGLALNQNLRALLTENAFWIHNYIRAIFFNSDDQQAVSNRLIKNQEEIGNLLGTYYGRSAAQKISSLLAENSSLISALVNSSNNPSQRDDLKNRWQKNSEDIATYLAQLNPEWAFSFDKLKKDILEQFSLITQEVDALQKNNWHA